MFAWITYRPPKLRWSKSSRLLQRVEFLVWVIIKNVSWIYASLQLPEYKGVCRTRQTSKMDLFATFGKSFILDVWQGFEYTSRFCSFCLCRDQCVTAIMFKAFSKDLNDYQIFQKLGSSLVYKGNLPLFSFFLKYVRSAFFELHYKFQSQGVKRQKSFILICKVIVSIFT